MGRFLFFALFIAGCGDLESDRVCFGGCHPQPPVCRSMIACLEKTGSDARSLDASFGPKGTCWETASNQEACTQTCVLQLGNLITESPAAGCSFPR